MWDLAIVSLNPLNTKLNYRPEKMLLNEDGTESVAHTMLTSSYFIHKFVLSWMHNYPAGETGDLDLVKPN